MEWDTRPAGGLTHERWDFTASLTSPTCVPSGPDDVALEFDLAMLIPDNRQRIETLVISAPGAAGDGLTLTPDDLNIWNWKQSNGNWYTFVFASDLQIPGPFVPVDGIWVSASSSTTQIDGKESAGSLSRYLPATVDQSVLASCTGG